MAKEIVWPTTPKNPDEFPHLAMTSVRTGSSNIGYSSRSARRAEQIYHDWSIRQRDELLRNGKKFLTPPGELNRVTTPVVIVLMPIRVGAEDPGEVSQSLTSVRTAAQLLFDANSEGNQGEKSTQQKLPTETVVLPWLNAERFDPRRVPTDEVELRRSQVHALEESIHDTLLTGDGYKPSVYTGFEEINRGYHMGELRNHMGYAAAGISRFAMDSLHMFNSTQVWLDADSQLSSNALLEATASLDLGKALIVNGTLHYTGGIFDKTVDEIATLSTNEKLLYVTEMLRRQMFDHLDPIEKRGYLAESGLATKYGTFISLGMCNEFSRANESYWLVQKANDTVKEWTDKEIYAYAPDPRAGMQDKFTMKGTYEGPLIDTRIESVVRYVNYLVSTSGRGLESHVAKNGRKALVGFDQGAEYSMYTLDSRREQYREQENEPNSDELKHLLDSIYSYFRESNGTLSAVGNIAVNQLLKKLQIIPGIDIFWTPKELSKKDRLMMPNS